MSLHERLSESMLELQQDCRPKLMKLPLLHRLESVDPLFGATPIPHQLEAKDIEFISLSFFKHFIFTSLSIETKIDVIRKMKLFSYQPNQVIFHQNQQGHHFFIITKGKVGIFIDNIQVNTLGSTQGFGELALLHDYPRSATAVALTKLIVWVLERDSFKEAMKKINSTNTEDNKKFLDQLSIFSDLSSAQKGKLLEAISEFKYSPGEVIFKEGEKGRICYFIKEGTVKSFSKSNSIDRELGPGDYFGMQALLTNARRADTASAVTAVDCIGLSKNDMEIALGNHLEEIILQRSINISIGKSSVLNELDEDIRAELIKNLSIQKFNQGHLVISSASNLSENLYLLLCGSLRSESNNIFYAYEAIGDIELCKNIKDHFSENIFAATDVTLAVIPQSIFYQITFCDSKYLTAKEIQVLKQVSIFKFLPRKKFVEVTNLFRKQTFQNGEMIIQQNSPGDLFFIIQSGKVDIVKDDSILRTSTKYDYFGERSLLFKELRTASVIANGEACCWTLTQSQFLKTLNGPMRKSIMKRIEQQDISFELGDLRCLKVLGKGSFGTVFLVINQRTNHLYAMKVILKECINQLQLENYINLEVKILMELEHVFILKFIKYISDEQRVYLLTEYVRGTEMFHMMKTLGRLDEIACRFYSACLLLILEYLHEREVVYRDLKPENVIIDEDGYPKLIDFGFSKFIKGRTYTLVGTPHYMAPEMIIGKGYSHYVDYWSLGILVYEQKFGKVPFAEEENDPVRIYAAILKRDLKFTEEGSREFIDFVEQLLDMNQFKRILNGRTKIKSHPWLSSILWDQLIMKDIPAPFIPQEVNDVQRHFNNCTVEEAVSRECKHF